MFKRLGFLAQKPVTGFFLAFFLTSLVTIAAAETMMLKTLVINPSKEKEQEVPIRSYLPAEAKPEIVVNREDLQIGFDTGKSLYYVEKTVKLKPGESYIMQVEMENIWVVSDEQIEAVQQDADQAVQKLEGTVSYSVAKIMHENISQTLEIIRGHQKSDDFMPQEHIANYRLDLKLLEQCKKDLNSIKEMSRAGIRAGNNLSSGQKAKASRFGSIAFSWKLILLVLVFLAVLSLGSFILWQQQLKRLMQVKELDATRTKFFNPDNLTSVQEADKSGPSEVRLTALYKDAEERAKTDDLTRVNNRRQFLEILKMKIATADAAKQSFYLAIFDIDLFKQINDKYGHGFGDQVIKNVAQTVAKKLGSEGQIGRYGGDEFVLFFDKDIRSEVAAKFERISTAIRNIELFTSAGESVKLSVSFGVARYYPGQGMDEKKLIDAADKELLSVKRTMRGKVSIATE